jgi:glycosyltransferase involved in cell wall biosynthesis
MSGPLHIVMTVDPEIPVPPVHYGGIERIVHMLVKELTRRGHRVDLFANPDSKPTATLIPYRGLHSRSVRDTMLNAAAVRSHVRRCGTVDVVHSFSRLAYLAPLMRTGVPLVQSYQRRVSPRSVFLGNVLGRSRLTFVACSEYCRGTAADPRGRWRVIPNGAPRDAYTFRPTVLAEAPLVFLGRIERLKGAHVAIDVARQAGCHLIIAGNHATSGPEADYFLREVLPACDGDGVRYVGAVDDRAKDELLGAARALIFPVQVDYDAAPIVLPEALACGTPIITFPLGGATEVVRSGVNGFACQSVGEMVDAVTSVASIDRAACRRLFEERYSDVAIADQYEALYRSLVPTRAAA